MMSGDNPDTDHLTENPLSLPSRGDIAIKVPPKLKPKPNPKPKPKAVVRPKTEASAHSITSPGRNAYLSSFLKEQQRRERMVQKKLTGSSAGVTKHFVRQTNGNGTRNDETIEVKQDRKDDSINNLDIESIKLIDSTSGQSDNDSRLTASTSPEPDNDPQDDSSVYDIVTFRNGKPEKFVPFKRSLSPSDSTFGIGCTLSMPENSFTRSAEELDSIIQTHFRGSTQEVPLYQNVVKTEPDPADSDEAIYCDMTKASRENADGVYMTMTKADLVSKNSFKEVGEESLYTPMMGDAIRGSSVTTYYKESDFDEHVRDVPVKKTEPCGVQEGNPILKFGWQRLHDVTSSGVLSNLSAKKIGLQEAKYELITSKVSYLKSLSIMQAVFINNTKLRQVLTKDEFDKLFHCIEPIKRCSEHFLADLLSGWPKDLFLTNMLTIVNQYAQSGFKIYVDYCSNKIGMDYTLNQIRLHKPEVNAHILRLERDEICDSHTLESFLVLPIQRITRFPLLVGEIVRRLPESDEEYLSWKQCWEQLKKMALQCNEAVRDAEFVRDANSVPMPPKDLKQSMVKKSPSDRKGSTGRTWTGLFSDRRQK